MLSNRFNGWRSRRLLSQAQKDVDLDQSVKLAAEAIELDPMNNEAHRFLLTAGKKHSRMRDIVRFYLELAGRFPDNALVYNHLGGVHFLMGDLKSAQEAYLKAKRLDAELVSPRSNLALMASFYGRYDEAIDEFEQCLRLDPNNSSAHGNLGLDYQSIGHMDKALIHLRRAFELDPIGYRMNTLADHYYIVGDYVQARHWYEKARDNDPIALTLDIRQVRNLLNLSHCCLKQRDYARCNQLLDTCSEIPGVNQNLDFHKRAGTAYFEQGLYSRALNCYEQALTLSAGNELVQDVIYRHIAKVYYQTGEFHKATAAFQLASFCRQSAVSFDIDWMTLLESSNQAESQASQLSGYIRHAFSLYRQGHWENAAVELQVAAQLDSGMGEVHIALGWVHLLLDNLTEAWKHIYLGIYHRNHDVAPFLLAGIAALFEGSYEQAGFYTGHALSLDAQSANAWAFRGHVYRCNCDYEAAAKCYAQALELNTQLVNVRYNLAHMCWKTGHSEEAISHLETLLETRSDHALGLELLGVLESELGLTEQASVTWHKLQKLNPYHQLIRKGPRIEA